MAGKKRAERKYRVIEVPCRPGTAPGRERFRGTRRDAEGYYEHLCESEPQGPYALVLVDGFGQPVYAAS